MGNGHADTEPVNIMVVSDPEATGGERAKILDFGLAKLMEPEAPGAGLTNTGTILGTPAYMAPEQCKSARAADDRSDVYSLGIILYEMLTADIPFDAETDAELLSMHMFQEPPSLSKRAPHVNPGLAQLVHRMLRKEPSTRPSAGEVVTELGQLMASGSGEIPGAAPPPRTRDAGERVTLVSRPEPQTRVRLPEGAAAEAAKQTGKQPGAQRKGSLLQSLLWVLAAILLLSCAGVVALLWFRNQQAVQTPALVHWSISSIPSKAEVRDSAGRLLGQTPFAIERPRGEGTETLILRLPGYAEQRLTFSLARDAAHSERLIALPKSGPGTPSGAEGATDEPPPATLSTDAGAQPSDGMEIVDLTVRNAAD